MGISDVTARLGLVALALGDYTLAQSLFEESLAAAHETEYKQRIAGSLSLLGELALAQANYATAHTCFEESLAQSKIVGDKLHITYALDDLGQVAHAQGNYAAALLYYNESLLLRRELGNSGGIADILISLGQLAVAQTDYATARSCFNESLSLCRATQNKCDRSWPFSRHGADGSQGMALCLAGLAAVATAQKQMEPAARLCGAADALIVTNRLSPLDCAHYDRTIAAIRAQLDEEAFAAAWAAVRAMTIEQAVAYALSEDS
jgi:tetratricopeptide (TPR) repeat protein